MPSPTFPPATITSALNAASTQTGVPLSVLTALANNESSYGSQSGAANGFMQMTGGAIAQVNQVFHTNYTAADMADPATNATAAAQYVQYLANNNGGDYNSAITAYGPGGQAAVNAAAAFGPVSPDTLAQAGYGPDGPNFNASGYLQKAQNSMGNSGLAPGSPTPQTNSAAINNPVNPNDPNPDVVDFSPLPYQNLTKEQIDSIAPPLVNYNGLTNVQPWYEDTNLLTGNPRLHKQGGFPITFEVYMDQMSANSLLTTQQNGGRPVTIPLNCSLERFKVSSRHIINKEPTRTGFHLTMWGMAADVIEGSGSTGLMINQFGVTDFFSLAGTTSEATNAVLNAFTHSPSGVDVAEVGLPTGNPIQPATPLTAEVANLNAIQVAGGGNLQPLSSSEPFRIAAEDAFVELLSLFKMNGTTYLQPSGYPFDSDNNNLPNISNNANNTSALAVYSSGVGATDFEIKARSNDVYKRGYVNMKFRNSQYLGFFKSLSWTLDAEKPYQWKFSFVFQVERTLSLVYYPTPTAAPTLGDTRPASSGVLNA
jgi:hypothetical protein